MSESVSQIVVLIVLDEWRADSQALLLTAGRIQADCTDSVEQESIHQFPALHVFVTDGEVEAVADILIYIFVI